MARLGHGTADSHTSGALLRHGRSHDMATAVLFGGRRRQVFTRLAGLSGARPGDRVLDVGCGTGYFTRVMARAVAPSGTAEGIDPSPEGITRARRITRPVNCTFSQGVGEALDAGDGAYDVVVSSLMIHHLPDELRPQAIREMLRVLRTGGRVLVADFRPPGSRTGATSSARSPGRPWRTRPSICSNPSSRRRLRAGPQRRRPAVHPLRAGGEANQRSVSTSPDGQRQRGRCHGTGAAEPTAGATGDTAHG